MDPEIRYAATLGFSLILWAPMLKSCVEGVMSLPSALVWYLGAVAVAWLCLAALDWLLTGFAHANTTRRREMLRQPVERVAELEAEADTPSGD